MPDRIDNEIMKRVLAIFCSLMLIGTSFLMGRIPAPCPTSKAGACCHGGQTMSCCQTKSDSSPFPAVPVSNHSESTLLLAFAPAIAFATVPEKPARTAWASSFIASTSAPALYTRDCALLL
ncbi:MAG TPA: hypothetical protein VN625_02540 [Desulfuromonadaceae bacterium]|nr:hypothetical protein [Desulfuromonadaceae bacterium]